MRWLLLPLLLGSSSALAASYEKIGTVPYTTTALAPVPRGSGAVYLADGSRGKYDCGQIQILHGKKKRTIHVFNGYRGKRPTALVSTPRAVYGITAEGGQHGKGTLFEIRGKRVRPLVHFTETTGAPRSLHAAGKTVYGTCEDGAFRWSGRALEFFPMPLIWSVAMVKGQLYATKNYYNDLYRFDGPTPTLIAEDWPAWTIPGKGALFGVTAYSGRYTYGNITEFKPATGGMRVIVDLQSYNGGRPTEMVALRNGAIYGANPEGIWQIAKRPRKVRALSSIRVMTTDGRRLYGLAGSLKQTAFVLKP